MAPVEPLGQGQCVDARLASSEAAPYSLSNIWRADRHPVLGAEWRRVGADFLASGGGRCRSGQTVLGFEKAGIVCNDSSGSSLLQLVPPLSRQGRTLNTTP